MYVWIWRHLPAPFALRLTVALALVALVITLLVAVVFPWVESLLPTTDVTIG